MSTMKIGYPRALLYYKYFPLWETFLTELGAEPVPSVPTNNRILSAGTVAAESELCLPVKVFYGHLLDLKDKVEAILIPRVVAVEKDAFTCPKFLGLPDLALASGAELPPILAPTIDKRLKRREQWASIYEVGEMFTDNRRKIRRAYKSGLRNLHEYHDKLLSGLTPLDILDGDIAEPSADRATAGVKIAIAGHAYNIFDTHTSMNLVKRLRHMGADVVTADAIPGRVLRREADTLPKRLFWTYEADVVGSVLHWARDHDVDGIIYVLSFACGPDSLIQTLLEHELRKMGSTVPMMSLVMDEHAAEAGFVTRVEAFVDMIARRKAQLKRQAAC